MKKYFSIVVLFVVTGCLSATQQPDVAGVNDLNSTTTATTTPSSTPPALELPVSAEVPILIYHHIRETRPTDSENDKTFIVDPGSFEQQLAYLQEYDFEPITFGDLIDYFDGRFSMPEKPVILSFDDGVINQYGNAFPLLQKYNMHATFFIFPNPIGRSQNYMNWQQLTELVDSGMEIGSHGWYHLYLDRISTQELEKELTGSKKILEANLDTDIRVLAYPFGEFDQHVIDALQAGGYEAARGIRNGTMHTSSTLFELDGYFITNSFSRFVNIVTQ